MGLCVCVSVCSPLKCRKYKRQRRLVVVFKTEKEEAGGLPPVMIYRQLEETEMGNRSEKLGFTICPLFSGVNIKCFSLETFQLFFSR